MVAGTAAGTGALAPMSTMQPLCDRCRVLRRQGDVRLADVSGRQLSAEDALTDLERLRGITQQDRALNSWAFRSFRDVADGDYIAARMAYRAEVRLPPKGCRQGVPGSRD